MRRSGAGFGAIALAIGLAAPGSGEETAPAVGLDQLLKLPPSVSTGVERRGGMTRGEWRSRFERIEAQLASEKESLAQAQKERDRVANSSDQWLLGAPGMTNTEAPLDYRLRQEISRHKEEIARLESAHDSLVVEANLAGVPEDWRRAAQ
ncbi:MAG TPA: hypothetical protein VNE71_16585 [Myxococcota bacterium]|nr:hypothetical protein [Myxococcota bacterium]